MQSCFGAIWGGGFVEATAQLYIIIKNILYIIYHPAKTSGSCTIKWCGNVTPEVSEDGRLWRVYQASLQLITVLLCKSSNKVTRMHKLGKISDLFSQLGEENDDCCCRPTDDVYDSFSELVFFVITRELLFEIYF